MELSLIEGFYGRPWSWSEREDYSKFLKDCGFKSYYYAPKADAFLRRRWREPFEPDHEKALKTFGNQLHAQGLEFGVGLTPFEVHFDFNDENKRLLARKIDAILSLGIDRLAVLFDDMKGGREDLASLQSDILNWILEYTHREGKKLRLAFCPTYYSSHPILDELFGKRPEKYLEQLGEMLPKEVDLIWTGEKICSETYTLTHLNSIAEKFQRPLFLWDNTPVNDGPKMCKFLHIKPISGRPAEIAKALRIHAVNPMNQAELSKIQILTLVESYQKREAYDASAAFLRAATKVGGESFALTLQKDLVLFHERGLDQIPELQKEELLQTYKKWTHKGAQEVIEWLQGHTVVGREVFLTQ